LFVSFGLLLLYSLMLCFRMDQFEAACEGDLRQLRVALTEDNVDDVDVIGSTPLQYAVSYERIECVKYCLEMHANVNARDRHGWTPLHNVSVNGNVHVVRMLLDAGAVVDATDNSGFTPLFRAIDYKRFDVAQMLLDLGAKVSNVKLDEYMPAIPGWIVTLVESRSNCRSASIIIVGIHKYHKTNITGNNDINVLKLISKHIWSMRMDDEWKRK
jgi:ankyrin repeat protein